MRTWVAALVTLGALAGCASSPPVGWHSLVPAAAASAAAPAAAPRATLGSLAVGPITVPDEVDRPQLVVRRDGVPTLLEDERWSEPLKSQLPRSLALGLAQRQPQLLVVATAGATVAVPDRRLVVDVQRFELQRERVVLRVVWALRPTAARDTPPPAPQLFEAAVPVEGSGNAAMVAAMRAALDQLVVQISRGL